MMRDELLKVYGDLPDGPVKTSLRGLVANLAAARDPSVVDFISSRVLRILNEYRSADPITRLQNIVAKARRTARRHKKSH